MNGQNWIVDEHLSSWAPKTPRLASIPLPDDVEESHEYLKSTKDETLYDANTRFTKEYEKERELLLAAFGPLMGHDDDDPLGNALELFQEEESTSLAASNLWSKSNSSQAISPNKRQESIGPYGSVDKKMQRELSRLSCATTRLPQPTPWWLQSLDVFLLRQ